jgi:hypothetical protein
MGAMSRAIEIAYAVKEDLEHSREILERMARILVHNGHSPKHLAGEFRIICGRLREPNRQWDPRKLKYFFELPEIIALWHADPQYLDNRGRPIALSLRGRGPSLSALIDRVLPNEDPTSVTRSLMRIQGVRKKGRQYTPTDRYFSYSRESGQVHGLTALLGLLRTLERNVSGPKKIAILERTALNPNFPLSALPAFHRRLKAQAGQVLWTIDGEMRRQEQKKTKGPRVRLGVGIFAFEEAVTRKRSRRRVRSTAARPSRASR